MQRLSSARASAPSLVTASRQRGVSTAGKVEGHSPRRVPPFDGVTAAEVVDLCPFSEDVRERAAAAGSMTEGLIAAADGSALAQLRARQAPPPLRESASCPALKPAAVKQFAAATKRRASRRRREIRAGHGCQLGHAARVSVKPSPSPRLPLAPVSPVLRENTTDWMKAWLQQRRQLSPEGGAKRQADCVSDAQAGVLPARGHKCQVDDKVVNILNIVAQDRQQNEVKKDEEEKEEVATQGDDEDDDQLADLVPEDRELSQNDEDNKLNNSGKFKKLHVSIDECREDIEVSEDEKEESDLSDDGSMSTSHTSTNTARTPHGDLELAATAFHRLADSEEHRLPRERLPTVLKWLGHAHPDVNVVEDILEQAIPFSFLTHDNVSVAVRMYETRHRKRMEGFIKEIMFAHHHRVSFSPKLIGSFAGSFTLSPNTKIGRIPSSKRSDLSVSDVESLFKRLNIVLLPGLLEELVMKTECCGIRTFCFKDVARIYGYWRQRCGFSEAELGQLQAIFARCDKDGNGVLDAAEVRAALALWRLVTKEPGLLQEDKKKGILHVSSHVYTSSEFIVLAAECRNDEFRELQTLAARAAAAEEDEMAPAWGMEGSSKFKVKALSCMFASLGYVRALPEQLKDFLAGCPEFANKDPLSHEEACWVLCRYSAAFGFTDAEHEVLKAIFCSYTKGCAADSRPILDHGQLLSAVRRLGYPSTAHQMNEVLRTLCLHDRDEGLDYAEYRRILAWLRDSELEELAAMFAKYEAGWPADKLGFGEKLRKLGIDSPLEQRGAVLIIEGEPLTREGAVRLVLARRQKMRLELEESYGFSEDDLAELRDIYTRYRSLEQNNSKTPFKSSGHTSKAWGSVRSSVSVMQTVAKDLLNFHPRARVQFESIPRGMTFAEFLDFVRLLLDRSHMKSLLREKEVTQAIELPADEAEGFLEVFQRADVDGSGLLDLEELRGLILGLTPQDHDEQDMAADLEQLFEEVVSEEERALNENLVDFASFLLIMQQLVHEDFHSINNTAEAVARKERRRNMWAASPSSKSC